MSVTAGFGALVVLAVLFGSFYLFDRIARQIIDTNSHQLMLLAGFVFLAGFGICLQMTLKIEFWRGKWK